MAYSTEVLTSDLSNTFKIGVVSRITNIPVDTLRIWERRYSVVVPCRSEKADRLYKREDINRLTLLKLLVDKGMCHDERGKEIIRILSPSKNKPHTHETRGFEVVMLSDL